MKTKIIIDSTADLIPELKNRLTIVPLTVHFGSDEYIDGVTINHRQFYEMLVNADSLPTTSQATPEAFSQAFHTLAPQEEAVVLTISSTLSGTCQSAMIAASEHPNIYVVDTGSAAIGAGILAELALQLADAGLSAKEIAHRLEQEKDRVRIVAMVDTLEYLQKGGRVSKAVAFAGGLLNIKPLLCIQNGQIHIVGKARGAKQAYSLLDAEIQKAGGIDFSATVLLGYTGLHDETLQNYLASSQVLKEHSTGDLPITPIGSVIGTHAGPGAFAVAFFARNH